MERVHRGSGRGYVIASASGATFAGGTMNAETVIISAVSGMAASLVAVPLGHWLAMRQHVSQRWWERKAEAYNAILLGVAQVRTALMDVRDELLNDSEEVDQAALKKAMEAWEDAAERLGPLGNQGTFIISPEASRILFQLQVPLQSPPVDGDVGAWMYRMVMELGGAAEEFGAEAKRDLGVS
jgi:hypothetical protein